MTPVVKAVPVIKVGCDVWFRFTENEKSEGCEEEQECQEVK